jgi:GT2 family glycosyltransferase
MTKNTSYLNQKNPIAVSNRLVRDRKYEEALARYEEALAYYESEYGLKSRLHKVVSSNIEYVKKKLKRNDVIVSKNIKIKKPDNFEQIYFNIIEKLDIFDQVWYLNEYGDKYKIEGNPLAHFLDIGVKNQLNPSKNFNTKYYLSSNPDVESSGVNPFIHYITQGHTENRLPIPPTTYYESRYSVSKPTYLPRLPIDASVVEKAVRVIAFYLPQFHAVPENDEWWGNGFTEWTNVRPAKPQFEGHYQPHVPDEYLEYYNLLDNKTQAKQIELAKQYGIEGFCFYLYWFTGHKLLQQPVDNYLADSKLDLPFCICWANENWTRRWDGLDQDLLMEQKYSAEDDIEFIENAVKYLHDPRYIRINGKPLLLVYRPKLFPDMKATAKRWRDWCADHGVGEIYLTYPQSFENVDPAEYGFDAACEFPPNNSSPPQINHKVSPLVKDFKTTVYDWRIFLDRSEKYIEPPYTLFRTVVPSWDNTARKKNKGTVFQNSCPNLFENWLERAFNNTLEKKTSEDEKIVFINAWNEWAEGAHLEPDEKYGYAWLQAVRNAHNRVTQQKLRHWSLDNIRWNKIQALFENEIPDKNSYAFLSNYLSVLQQGKRFGLDYELIDGVPKWKNGDEIYNLNKFEDISEIHKRIYRDGPCCFVILQYNRSDMTISCVKSIQKLEKNGMKINIIIVDNNSDKYHYELVKQTFNNSQEVIILRNYENLGFSVGNNIGYKYAKEKLNAKFCVVINNDTEIKQPDFLKKLLELFDKYSFSLLGPDVLIGDGRHENPWNDYIYSIEEFKELKDLRSLERKNFTDSGQAQFKKLGKSTASSDILINPILQGAVFVVSPIFIANHEYIFDKRLFLYGEEFLLATEYLLNGDLAIYSKQLEVEHHEGATTAKLPTKLKIMHGYDSVIKSTKLCLKRLLRADDAAKGKTIDHSDIDVLRDIITEDRHHILFDLFFCQPGYHGGGEYGKAIFKKLVDEYSKSGGFDLWAALNPDLFIDPWVWKVCRTYGINVISVKSYQDIINLVNMDIFYSFYTPAIVVYTGYEYMKRVGTRLPFRTQKTRIIGTLLDIRDYELANTYESIHKVRKNVGCKYENFMSKDTESSLYQKKKDEAIELKIMYKNIINDSRVEIVTISKYCETSIKENIGIPANEIKVLMAPMKIRPIPRFDSFSEFGTHEKNYALILNAGRFEKNVCTAIKAFDQIFSNYQCPDFFKVVLTGLQNISDSGLEKIVNAERFVVLGEVSPENLEYLLKNAKFLVYPSFNEGFGYPPIEAMSYGTTAVVSNVTAIPEFCADNAIYINPYDFDSVYSKLKICIIQKNLKKPKSEYIEYLKNRQDNDLKRMIEIIVNGENI